MLKQLFLFSFFIAFTFSSVHAEEVTPEDLSKKISDQVSSSVKQESGDCYEPIPYIDETQTLYLFPGSCSRIYMEIPNEIVFQPMKHSKISDGITSFEKILTGEGYQKVTFTSQYSDTKLLIYQKNDSLCYLKITGDVGMTSIHYNIYTGCAENIATQKEAIYPFMQHLKLVGKEIGIVTEFNSDFYKIFKEISLDESVSFYVSHTNLGRNILVHLDSNGKMRTLYRGNALELPCYLHEKQAVPMDILRRNHVDCLGYNPAPSTHIRTMIENILQQISPKHGYHINTTLNIGNNSIVGKNDMTYKTEMVQALFSIEKENMIMESEIYNPNTELAYNQAVIDTLEQTNAILLKEGFKEKDYSNIRWNKNSSLKEYVKDDIFCQVEYTFDVNPGIFNLQCTDAVTKIEKYLLPVRYLLKANNATSMLELAYKDKTYLTVRYRVFAPGLGMIIFKRDDAGYHVIYTTEADDFPKCEEVQKLNIPPDVYMDCE